MAMATQGIHSDFLKAVCQFSIPHGSKTRQLARVEDISPLREGNFPTVFYHLCAPAKAWSMWFPLLVTAKVRPQKVYGRPTAAPAQKDHSNLVLRENRFPVPAPTPAHACGQLGPKIISISLLL